MRTWLVAAIEGAILLVAIVIAYSKHSGGRPHREAYRDYRTAVAALQAGRSGEAGGHLKKLEAYCRYHQGVPPGNVCSGAKFVPQIRFLRAGLALRAGDLETATGLYEEAAEDGHADEELQALSRTALAALAFKTYEAKDPERGADKALDILAGARGRVPDALVAEGACLLWRKRYAEAAQRYKKARESKRPMSLEACKGLYMGSALVLAQEGDLTGAQGELARAQLYDKDWARPREYIQFLAVQLLSRDERGDPQRIKARERLLSSIERSWNRYTTIGDKPTQYATLTAIGLAYARSAREARRRNDREAERAKLRRAMSTFEQAAELDQKNPAAFRSIAAVRWRLLLNLRADLAELTRRRPNASRKVRVSLNRQIRQLTSELPAAEDAYAAAQRRLVEMGALSEEEEVAGLKAVAGFALTHAEAAGWAEGELAAALEALNAVLERSPGEPEALRAKGALLHKQGKRVEALAAWKQALENGEDPSLSKLVGAYESKPRIVLWRPSVPPLGKGKAFLVRSRTPLVGALLAPARAGDTVKPEDVTLYLDGTQVPAKLAGTEVLYLVPATAPLADGRHTVRVRLKGRLNETVERSFEFLVDNSPPEVDEVSPRENGTAKAGRPKIKIRYHDALSGVDPSSVRLELRSVPPTQPALIVTLVERGRYTFNYPESGIVKDTSAATPKFLMTVPSRPLPRGGRYQLILTVGDARGLKATKAWQFSVED